ncbi:DEAD/DEAH box helicase [Neobacillus sp. SAB-20_R2A]|uniref:helicase C-terminal domain-containing protein n=1 Tax=Neobacillus sp. SAB-20_R2A TaxID=3120519 RepID=UPI003C6E6693
MIDLEQRETEILSSLKDFQKATVQRIHELFTNGYHRVLVADEVGLGKTLIARGVVAKTARFHHEKLNDDLFKVVYVCSNQGIATQNLAKLKIDDRVTIEGLTDTRLSMQHLKIFENKFDPKIKENFIQLIPLTPSTSFDMKSGGGNVAERSLLYVVLKDYKPLKPYLNEFELLMIDKAPGRWDSWKGWFETKARKCNQVSNEEYTKTILGKVEAYLSHQEDLLPEIIQICVDIKKDGQRGKRVNGALHVIHKIRKMMAEISMDLMDADLVIMDEFQRFKELINNDGESETALLAKKFFNTPKSNEQAVKILLLSATPYKLYSTLEEMADSKSDDHYQEFMQVMDFLFEKQPDHRQKFRQVWNDFSIALSQLTSNDFAILSAKKQAAEDYLYKGIARTERMLVDGAGSLISSSMEKNILNITEQDVLSFVEMDHLLQEMELTDKVPVDYVKSAPYLMSYMEHYKLKQKVTHYFRKHRDKIKLARKPVLWMNRDIIAKYGKLPEANARLSKLKEIAIPKQAERLLWVPPSLPYYEPGGCFQGQSQFSKVLVFSAWEMVPRAIATLVSYDAERLTVGELIKKTPSKKNKKENRSYFAKNRFPQPRLTFAMKDHAPTNMNHLALVYPSATLAKLFQPAEVVNKKLSLKELKDELVENIKVLLDQVPNEIKDGKAGLDERWYYVAPLLFDINEEVILDWFSKDQLFVMEDDEEKQDKENEAAFAKHFEELKDIFQNVHQLRLGKQPDDLLDVLVNMVLGSPAVCALRMMGQYDSESIPYAIQLAKAILSRFNTQEAISIVELEYGKRNSQDVHWQNVLKYSVDGNMQAMLDEYAHMLMEEGALKDKEELLRNKQLVKMMVKALKTRTASFNVDTYAHFKQRILQDGRKQNGEKEHYIKMRTNYAVGFYDTRNEENTLNRKDNIRLSFNSPFRPFVLATTSIGQEGLDFHYYCRKIMHWNLPSNPVELEQREGRINRYKCFAIRQNIAAKYGSIPFQANIWDELFDTALREENDEGTSELVPFWCLPDNQEIKIERVVPAYPLSRDIPKYERLMKILALYRLSLGQARQEELLEYLVSNDIEVEQLKELFMNLSPYYKERVCVTEHLISTKN